MGLPIATTRGRALLGGRKRTYADKVGAITPANLIDWSKMAEPSGGTALDSSQLASHGAYTGVTLGATGIGDGLTAASFDGTTSFNNRYTAARAAAFNPAEITLSVWGKVSAAGIWSDGAIHTLGIFRTDGSNRLQIFKNTTNNQLVFVYGAGGTIKTVSDTSLAATTAWFHVAITVSQSGDAMKAYINGAQVGATQSGLGTWAGALSSTLCNYGAFSTVPGDVWSGTLAHGMLRTVALTEAQVASLANTDP